MHSTVIKGRTVAHNQLIQNGSHWVAASATTTTVTYDASKNTVTANIGSSTTSFFQIVAVDVPSIISGHKYLARFTSNWTLSGGKTPIGGSSQLITFAAPAGGVAQRIPIDNTQGLNEIIFTATADAAYGRLQYQLYTSANMVSGDTVTLSNCGLKDLTAEGYTDAETTDVATFKAAFLKKRGYPLPVYEAFDTGSLANVDGTYRLRAKNMLDPSKRTNYSTRVYFYQADGYVVKAGTQYTFSASIFTNGLYVREYQSGESIYVAYGASTLTFTPTETKTVYFDAYWSTAPSGGTSSVSFQLELGSQATAYEPYYNGGSIDCSSAPMNGFDDTVCDEKDFATGVRTTRMVDLALGDQTWQYESSSNRMYCTPTTAVKSVSNSSVANGICSIYQTVTANATYSHTTDKSIAVNASGQIYVYDSAYTDAAIFKIAMTNGNVHLVAELATPVVSTETPQPVYTQYGYNVLEPVSGGVQSAEVDTVYYENIAGYIDKKLAEG